MEANYKRKLDCILDSMDVIVPDGPHCGFYGEKVDPSSKKVKICVNARLEAFAPLDGYHGGGFSDSEVYRTSFSCDGMEEDLKGGGGGGCRTEMEDAEEDREIPTTSEVIDSLRKVMLWMSAQEDSNSDHIQYLTHVERYALSKQDTYIQQRKITEYFIKHD